MRKQTGRLAFGGVMTALALVFLLLTATPVATVALAALAGVCGIPVVVELGKKAGLIHYAAVALIALWLIPTLQGKVMYIAFFGYYTVLKAWVESHIRSRITEWAVKLTVFLLALGGAGGVLYYLLQPVFPEWVTFWMAPIAVVALCAVFVVYDRALTGLIGLYLERVHPRLHRLFKV